MSKDREIPSNKVKIQFNIEDNFKKKGGVNPPSTKPKPNFTPPPQNPKRNR